MLLDQAKRFYSDADIDISDDSRMQAHIIKCIAALTTIQKNSETCRNELQKLSYDAFLNCVSEMTSAALKDGSDPAMDMLVDAVSDTMEWHPFHYAAASKCSSDTMLQVIGKECIEERDKAIGQREVTPLHLAAAKRDPDLNIVRRVMDFSIRLARAKDANGDLPLHYAVQHSNSVQLIQELLQAYPDGAVAKNDKGETFVHLLCRSTSPEAPTILRVVLAAVPDVARIQNNVGYLPLHEAINGDLPDAIRLEMAQQLIAVYPEGAAVPNVDGYCPIHILVESKYRSVGPILDMILESHPAAASTADGNDLLPLHLVNDVKVAERLVEVYPEALSVNVPFNGTPLHCASGSDNVEVFQYLYECRPESLQEVSEDNGWRPIHSYSYYSSSLAMLRAVYELDPSAISSVTGNGKTPLHCLTCSYSFSRFSTPSANDMDKLYFLLQRYPAAASIPYIDGNTPYSICHVNHTHARRLLLRAAPALDPEALHELNYSARRMALFLFFLGSRRDGERTLFTKLSLSPKGQSLVRRVVEFL